MKFRTGIRNSEIPEGEYIVIIYDIILKQTSKRPSYEFYFRVTEGEHKGTEMKGFCNADYEMFSNRTKLWEWYEKVTCTEFEPDIEIDMDDFKEKLLRVRVETKTSRKTGNRFSNVTEILGLKHDLR